MLTLSLGLIIKFSPSEIVLGKDDAKFVIVMRDLIPFHTFPCLLIPFQDLLPFFGVIVIRVKVFLQYFFYNFVKVWIRGFCGFFIVN